MTYYGQTIQSLKKRFDDHCRTTSNCLYLKNAIQIYGKEQFTITILESVTVESKVELNNKLNFLEQKYIKENNSLYPNGYNLTSGGDATTFSKESVEKRVKKLKKSVICNETGQVWASIKECAEYFGAKPEAVHRVLRGVRKHFRNFTFSYFNSKPVHFSLEAKSKLSEISKKQTKKYSKSLTKEQIDKMKSPVICNETGVKYDSLSDAAKALNGHSSGISRVLLKKRKSYKGFTFSYL